MSFKTRQWFLDEIRDRHGLTGTKALTAFQKGLALFSKLKRKGFPGTQIWDQFEIEFEPVIKGIKTPAAQPAAA